MRRYFSSFFIAISFYAFFAVCLFYLMANDKIFIKKAEETKLISLNHIELKPEIKEEKKEPEPQTKEIIKEEKIVETPKPITPKKVEKKEIEKKTVEKITEKKVVEKQEFEPTKKIQEQVFNKIEEKAPSNENKPNTVDVNQETSSEQINQSPKMPENIDKIIEDVNKN